ncbi:FUSC family protein [Cupriavidus sp. EM10]|uniref:FUSC family protein n=1 Tax=Cupriavidus sp. EM10 TaxID=2839983 RepID=UPI001C005AEB|nr:FUSC family protein [Cupriavidus sp. EM10]QWE97577.1 FUSC family protein [Cupriavidus sp. EM10]
MAKIQIFKTVDLKTLRHIASDPAWGAWAFAIRTTAASLIALYIAFLMNLDDPKWAAMTVWIVAQPNRGMTLSKSQYRIVGTMIGAAVALILTALFAQAPEMFFLALAVWIGICTGVATSLRNFRAYAGVLAGYTAAIVGMGAATAPLHAFDIAVARCLYILLGIVVEAVLTSILVSGDPAKDIRERFGRYTTQASSLCAKLLRREQDTVAMHRVFAGALTLDTAAEFAATASSTARQKLGQLRELAMAVLVQMAAAQTLGEQLRKQPEIDNGLIEETARLLDRTADAPDVLTRDILEVKAKVDLALKREWNARSGDSTPRLVGLNRIGLVLAALLRATTRAAQLDYRYAVPSRQRIAFHIDTVLAWRNGIRAFAAVLAAAAFWTFSAWPSGAGFVTVAGVVSALFAARPNSVGVSLAFLKGAACAALAAAICNFALLPAVSGYVPFACVVALFMVCVGRAMCDGRVAAIGSGAGVFFWNFISPLNTARIDDTAFLNGALATLIGIAFGAAAFAILFPTDPAAIRRRLRQAACRDLIRISGSRSGSHAEAWLGRTADRLSRLLVIGGADRAGDEAEVRGHVAVWAIGYSLVAIRGSAIHHAAARRPLCAVQRSLQRAEFERAAAICRSSAARLQRRSKRTPRTNGKA